MDPDTYSDLYSPWMEARAALHHTDPYSPAVTAQIQKDIYGHVLRPTETWDPEAFVYPAFIVFPLAPFTHLPWPAVQLLFAIVTPFVILAAAWAWLRLCQPNLGQPNMGQPNRDRLTTIAILALIVASWPAVWGCYQRQPSVFVAAAIAFSVLLFRPRSDIASEIGPDIASDIASGILLALATVKPQLVLLLAAWLLLLAIRHRRWRFVSAFALALVLLVTGSLALVPGWIPHWIHATIAYTHAAGKISLPTFVFGRTIGLLADAALLLALCLRLWKLWPAPPTSPAFVQSVSLVLAVTVCLMPANPWLLFNDLLLIPALLVLSAHRPAKSFPGLLLALAATALFLALLVTPLCAALGLLVGFTINLVMPPFLLNYLLPLPVAAAILFVPTAATPARPTLPVSGSLENHRPLNPRGPLQPATIQLHFPSARA
jgi:hypothetical protein